MLQFDVTTVVIFITVTLIVYGILRYYKPKELESGESKIIVAVITGVLIAFIFYYFTLEQPESLLTDSFYETGAKLENGFGSLE